MTSAGTRELDKGVCAYSHGDRYPSATYLLTTGQYTSRMFCAQKGLNYFFEERKFYHQVGNAAYSLLSSNCEMCWKIKTSTKVVSSVSISFRKVTLFQSTAFLVCLYFPFFIK